MKLSNTTKLTLIASAIVSFIGITQAQAAVTVDTVIGPKTTGNTTTNILGRLIKPYQIAYVPIGATGVQAKYQGSAYIASFGLKTVYNDEKDIEGSSDVDSESWLAKGYSRFIQVKDPAKDAKGEVTYWDAKDGAKIPNSDNIGSPTGTSDFVKNLVVLEKLEKAIGEHVDNPNSITEFYATHPGWKWDYKNTYEWLQPLHAIDFNGTKLLGSQTFTGKYVTVDLAKPANPATPNGQTTNQGTAIKAGAIQVGPTSANQNGELNSGSAYGDFDTQPSGVLNLIRSRLSKYSKDGNQIYAGVRGVEEDPNGGLLFTSKLAKFDSNVTSYGPLPNLGYVANATTGHALFVGKSGKLYSAGLDFKADVAGALTTYKVDPTKTPGEEYSFLNIHVVEQAGKPKFVYAINSIDYDPESEDVNTFAKYVEAFANDALGIATPTKPSTGKKRGLYIYEVDESTKTLKQLAYYPAVQAVDLAVDSNGTTDDIYFNDRISRTVQKVVFNTNTGTAVTAASNATDIKDFAVATANNGSSNIDIPANFVKPNEGIGCVSSNLALVKENSGKALILTAVYNKTLAEVNANYNKQNCNAIYRITGL